MVYYDKRFDRINDFGALYGLNKDKKKPSDPLRA